MFGDVNKMAHAFEVTWLSKNVSQTDIPNFYQEVLFVQLEMSLSLKMIADTL